MRKILLDITEVDENSIIMQNGDKWFAYNHDAEKILPIIKEEGTNAIRRN